MYTKDVFRLNNNYDRTITPNSKFISPLTVNFEIDIADPSNEIVVSVQIYSLNDEDIKNKELSTTNLLDFHTC